MKKEIQIFIDNSEIDDEDDNLYIVFYNKKEM